VVAGLRQDDPDVGHRRLGEDAGHVALGERGIQRVDVVPLDRPCGLGKVDRRAHVVGARAGLAVDGDRERLVDRAVVAPGVDQDLGPAGHRPREADREPVGVGGGQRELPVGEAETPPELLPHPGRVLRGEHQRHATGGLGGDRLRGCRRGVAGHRPGVAKAEVDVGVAVDVGEPRARCLGDEDGKSARPLGHPRHRHAGQKRLAPPLEQLPRAGMLRDEALLLGAKERAQPRAIELPGHGAGGSLSPVAANASALLTSMSNRVSLASRSVWTNQNSASIGAPL
jgi:hypothetical protein